MHSLVLHYSNFTLSMYMLSINIYFLASNVYVLTSIQFHLLIKMVCCRNIGFNAQLFLKTLKIIILLSLRLYSTTMYRIIKDLPKKKNIQIKN